MGRNVPDHVFGSVLQILRVTFLAGCGILSVAALDPDRSISQFHHTAWGREEGAPNQIRAIAQTTDGFLWLGTAAGLFRFDGIKFEAFQPAEGQPKLSSNSIYSLFATPEGGLFVGHGFAGVSFVSSGGTVVNYGEADGLPAGRIRGFALDTEGSIWAAAGSGLARFEGSKWERIGAERGFKGKVAQAVLADRTGTIWVATEDTLLYLPKGGAAFQPTGESTGQVLRIVEAPDGSIYIAETNRSVRQLRAPGSDRSSFGPEVKVGSVSILFDRDGAFWISTVGDGIRRLRSIEPFRGQTIAQFGTEAEIFTERDGLTSDYYMSVFEDREGNIWLGSSDGLDRFRTSEMVPVRFPPGYHDFGLAAGENGEVWTASSNLGLSRIVDGRKPMPAGPELAASVIYRDRWGTIWTAGSYGVYQLNASGVRFIKMPPNFKVFGASSLMVDRAGVLYALTDQEGPITLKGGVWAPVDRRSELPQLPLITGHIDSEDRLWVGYAGSNVAVMDATSVRTFSSQDGLDIGDVKVIHEASGQLWFGGTRGSAWFDGQRFRKLEANDADAFNDVSGIVDGNDGSLWLNAGKGVVRISAEEISRFREIPRHRVSFRLFDFLDGLPGTAQQSRPYPTAARGSDGRLWFSTNDGVAWIDPSKIVENPPPPVAISAITADERSFEPLGKTVLPARTTRLRIEFTALSLAIPERVRFRYRLEGSDEEWREAGTRREAFYTNLGPGKYRFELVAANGSGPWSEQPTSIEFEIAAAFYQTYWFYALCAAAAALLLWLAYRWRIRMIKARLSSKFRERLAERRRIAQDLHDDLLQGFVSAAMQLNVASDQLPDGSDLKSCLIRIEDQLRNVVEKGREKVSNLRSGGVNGDLYLDELLEEAIDEIREHFAGVVILVPAGRPRRLDPQVLDGVIHITREAMINAARHAKAGRIEVRVTYRRTELNVTIQDDGTGIDPTFIHAGKDGHWGLSMMNERADEIGGKLQVANISSGGTVVEFKIPGNLAYAASNQEPGIN